MKIRPVGANLLHVDKETEGREGMRQLMVAFRNSANAPKNHKQLDHLEHLRKARIDLRVITFDGTKWSGHGPKAVLYENGNEHSSSTKAGKCSRTTTSLQFDILSLHRTS
jgi:hypothetical protein